MHRLWRFAAHTQVGASLGSAPLTRAMSLSATATSSKAYPSHPRVGIGIVAFRPSKTTPAEPQVLLIKRGTEPNKGMWSFPGGSLELGETIVQCAVREVLEETGIHIRHITEPGSQFWSSSLNYPTAFAAADCIDHDKADGRIKFHYCIVEVAALAADPLQEPVPADDAEDAIWQDVKDISHLPGLTEGCDRLTHEAVRIFGIAEALTSPMGA